MGSFKPDRDIPAEANIAQRHQILALVDERDRLRQEAAWRRRAMSDAQDALAHDDGRAAWDALNRHEGQT